MEPDGAQRGWRDWFRVHVRIGADEVTASDRRLRWRGLPTVTLVVEGDGSVAKVVAVGESYEAVSELSDEASAQGCSTRRASPHEHGQSPRTVGGPNEAVWFRIGPDSTLDLDLLEVLVMYAARVRDGERGALWWLWPVLTPRRAPQVSVDWPTEERARDVVAFRLASAMELSRLRVGGHDYSSRLAPWRRARLVAEALGLASWLGLLVGVGYLARARPELSIHVFGVSVSAAFLGVYGLKRALKHWCGRVLKREATKVQHEGGRVPLRRS